MTLLHFNGNVLLILKIKTNNQDLFVVILMLICASNKYFVVAKFTYSYKADISVFTLKF